MPGQPNPSSRSGRDPQPSADPAEIALKVKAALVKQALESPEFRRLALSDPQAAVRRCRFLAGGEEYLPAGLTLRVVEETNRVLYLVIPHHTAEHPDPNNPKEVLLRKARQDPAFLRRLVADPRGVIESEFVVELPHDFEIQVLREGPHESIAVLPGDLRPDDIVGVPDDLLDYQASAWGGGDGCNKTFLGSLIENLCKQEPKESDFVSPFCKTDDIDCPIVQPL